MSNGLCHDTCEANYAFAIVQGQNCWCSNYIPSNQQSTSNCNEPCPGFPSDLCGSSSGLFGYIALNLKPSGTAGASSSSAKPSSVSSDMPSKLIPSPSPSSLSTSLLRSSFSSSIFVVPSVSFFFYPAFEFVNGMDVTFEVPLLSCCIGLFKCQRTARCACLETNFVPFPFQRSASVHCNRGLNFLPCRQVPPDGNILLLLLFLLPLPLLPPGRRQLLSLSMLRPRLRRKVLCIYHLYGLRPFFAHTSPCQDTFLVLYANNVL
jgi:hypothetical protein